MHAVNIMRGSRNFHERGSNENGNFWSQTRRGGVQPPKNPEITFFLGKIFKFQGVSGPPVPPSGSAHEYYAKPQCLVGNTDSRATEMLDNLFSICRGYNLLPSILKNLCFTPSLEYSLISSLMHAKYYLSHNCNWKK